MKKLIFTVDLGHFKAYRVTKNPLESERIELIRSSDSKSGREKLGEILTDQAGSFGLSGGKSGVKGYGEPHNLELENTKRITKQIAADIKKVFDQEKSPDCCIAAPKSVFNQIFESLDQSVRSKISKRVSADLTKMDKSEILSYFSQ